MSDELSSSIKVGVDYMRGNQIFPMMLGGIAAMANDAVTRKIDGKPYKDKKFKVKKRKWQLAKKARRSNR